MNFKSCFIGKESIILIYKLIHKKLIHIILIVKVNCVIYVFLKIVFKLSYLFIWKSFFPFTKASVLPNGEALDLNRVPDPTCDNTRNNCMDHEPLKRSHGTNNWTCRNCVILFSCLKFIQSNFIIIA